MSRRLAGKKALLSAAAQGIGRASALAFAAEGAEVIATDINTEILSEIADIDGITVRTLDVTDGDAIATTAAEVGAIDILLNVAGFVHHGSVLDCTEDEWDFGFDLNVKAAFRTVRAFLPTMLENGGGSIINMASVASSLRGLPDRLVYGATKAAVIGFTKSVAADYIRQGIRCNAICPGTVQSPSLDNRIAAFDDPIQARKEFIARQPLGRLGSTEEIAAMAIYLASDESRYTTGTTMIVDGGVTL